MIKNLFKAEVRFYFVAVRYKPDFEHMKLEFLLPYSMLL